MPQESKAFIKDLYVIVGGALALAVMSYLADQFYKVDPSLNASMFPLNWY
jgi:hypothetical protein